MSYPFSCNPLQIAHKFHALILNKSNQSRKESNKQYKRALVSAQTDYFLEQSHIIDKMKQSRVS